jgi:branched-chain amino acid transport system ATP-binding protein
VTTILETLEVSKRFGGVRALTEVSMYVEENEILSILGPNGSGKTTLFNIISGFMRPTSGQVRLRGKRIEGVRPHQLVDRGLARTFQQTMVFPSMSAEQNVLIAGRRAGLTPAAGAALLDECGLSAVRAQRADSLPYGSQKRLGAAMAVATGARVLLLDEPGAGLGSEETAELSALIRRVRDSGRTLVLIDHDMSFVLPLSDRVSVLDAGRLIFDGSPSEVVNDPQVISVYLGSA